MIGHEAITDNIIAFYKMVSGEHHHQYDGLPGIDVIAMPDKSWPAYILGDALPSLSIFEKMVQEMKADKLPPFWIRMADKSREFDSQAIKLGLRPVNKWIGMSLQKKQPFNLSSPKDELVFKRIDQPNNLGNWIQRVNEELTISKKIKFEVLAKLLNQKEIEFFQLLEGEKVVSTLLMFYYKNVAGIYLVSTEEKSRGKGYGRFITSKAIDIGIQKSYSNFVLHSSALGYKVYSKLDFQSVCEYNIYWLVGKM